MPAGAEGTGTPTERALERPALYYPYIHIRSEHWLKGTLLCVPSVKRIVPETYTPEDVPQIASYVNIEGPNGKLLQSVPSVSPAANDAQRRLLEKLRAKEKQIRLRFRRGQAPQPDAYWIHDAKFNHELLTYLRSCDLAWPSQHDRAYGHRTWYALHPTLGSAIMTTLGLSIAREQCYDIVTPSSEFHEALLAKSETAVVDALLTGDKQGRKASAAQARHDLGQLVIALTGVNFQALRPEDIPELQASKHFRRFQRLIRSEAQAIDGDVLPDEYHRHLDDHAHEIVEAWQDTRTDVSKDMREALFEQGLGLSAQALNSLLTEAETTGLLIAGGVAVGLLVRRTLAVRRKRRTADPYQYLTEIVRAENQLLRATFPLGLER